MIFCVGKTKTSYFIVPTASLSDSISIIDTFNTLEPSKSAFGMTGSHFTTVSRTGKVTENQSPSKLNISNSYHVGRLVVKAKLIRTRTSKPKLCPCHTVLEEPRGQGHALEDSQLCMLVICNEHLGPDLQNILR